MKAIMLWKPEQMELVDLPLRPLGPGEELLKVEACSICGSDLEGYHGLHPTMMLPRVMGHEVASTVAEVGPIGPSIDTRAGSVHWQPDRWSGFPVPAHG